MKIHERATFKRILRGAQESLESANNIIGRANLTHGDFGAIQTAASQAAQAARELSELLGYIRAMEDVRREDCNVRPS